MAYTRVNCRGTDFTVDWEVVERFVLSYWRSCYQYDLSNDVTMSESTWYNPFSWSLPSIRTIDVPWDRVRAAARTACDRDMAVYRQAASTDMRSIAEDVKSKLEQTAVNRRYFQNYLKDIQSGNMKEIDKSVEEYNGMIEWARFVRDGSADVITIGSTIATGGTGLALLGAASTFKGFGKFQDTGRIGSAVTYGAGNLVVGLFKVNGKKLTAAGEYTLIVVQGVLEGATSVGPGDSFAKGIEKGSLKVASAGAAQAVFGSGMAKRVFARLPVPFTVWVEQPKKPGMTMWIDEANDFVAGVTKKAGEKTAKAGIQALGSSPPPAAAPRTSSAGFADEVPFEQMFLLHFSIINNQKGIGHGW